MDAVATKKDVAGVIRIMAKRLGLSRTEVINAINRYWGVDEHLTAPTQPALSQEQKYGKRILE